MQQQQQQQRRAARGGGRGPGRPRATELPSSSRRRCAHDDPPTCTLCHRVAGRGGSSPPPDSSPSRASRRTSTGSTDSLQHICGPRRLLLQRVLDLTGRHLRICTMLLIAAFVGALHWYHISNLFENDRHFSHLSTLEREMSFRTEMGLYYSFFKTVIEAPTFFTGLLSIIEDTSTEYPLTINALKRFNVYPEVVLAFFYRMYQWFGEFAGFQIKTCWTVNRGSGLSSVESCEGMGDPAYFYVYMVFVLNGLLMSLFFLYGAYLSMSALGGLVTVACIFYNHGECTRVMWTPPLRESFSYPFIVLQMFIVTHILRVPVVKNRNWLFLLFSNVAFILSWQFAQFVLLTQILCLFAVYVIGILSPRKMQAIVLVHLASLWLCWVLMFGNSMLLTSYYSFCLAISWSKRPERPAPSSMRRIYMKRFLQLWEDTAVAIWDLKVIIEIRGWFIRIHGHELVKWALQVMALVVGTVFLKFIIPKLTRVTDDAHITNLILSKITGYQDFHTLMYTCAAEYDFMELETPLRYMKTLLLPVVVLVFSYIAIRTLYNVAIHLKQSQRDPCRALQERWEHSDDSELVYHALQLVAYALLAIFIMRLKLFLTPHMCLMASLICSKQVFRSWPFNIKHHFVVFVILVLMSIQGVINIQSQWRIMGEFNNVPQEELLDWITFNTKPNAVFAGAMPTMASVKLSTGRSIVNHPHYEDANLRAKTKIVYSVYSRKPALEVKTNLLKLGVEYYILEESWCVRRTKPGCTMPEIWDVDDPVNARKTPLCTILKTKSRPHFTLRFQNNIYKVLKIVQE